MPATRTVPFRTWCGLAVLLLPALLTSMDISLLFVAAPAIAADLHPSSTQWLWTLDIYSFLMAALLIPMGSLGDRIGRRRMLLIGAALFGTVSVALAYAPTAGLLILGRALLAVGGATLAPSTLSLIRGMFPEENSRRAAVSAWTVAFVGGAVAGPVLGGVLLEHFWWGSVFFINAPVMLLLLLAGPFLIVESGRLNSGRFDVSGAISSLVAILSLVFALTEIGRHGLGPDALAAVAIGAVAAAVFIVRQRRARDPLIDVALFGVPAFLGAVGVNTLTAMVITGLGSLVFPFLQIVHGLTPLQSALWALPTFAGSFLGAAAASKLARRFSARSLLCSGLFCAAIGLFAVSMISPHTGLSIFLTGYTAITFGIGITVTIGNSLVLSSAPAGRAGAAAGISETSGQLGSALGIAVFGTIAGAVYRAAMGHSAPPGTGSAALDTVTAAPVADRAVFDAAAAAYTDGVVTVALIGAVLTAAVVIVSVVR